MALPITNGTAMGYLNPILSLPAAQELLNQPIEQLLAIELLLRRIRADADRLAELAWRARRTEAAYYWRCVATYSRHIAHVASQRSAPRVARPALAIMPHAGDDLAESTPVTAAGYLSRVFLLPAAQALLDLPPSPRVALACLFLQIGTYAERLAEQSWAKRKAPMAHYWGLVSIHVRRLARTVRLGSRRQHSAQGAQPGEAVIC